MSRPSITPLRPAARRILGALLVVGMLAWIGPEVQARPHLPGTIVMDMLRIRPRASANPGYLPLVGSPALRWLDPPPPPTTPSQAPVVLYNPAVSTSSTTGNSPALPVAASSSDAGQPPALQPKDFLPFFQRDNKPPPVSASANEGLLFAPARPALPTSSADFRQQ